MRGRVVVAVVGLVAVGVVVAGVRVGTSGSVNRPGFPGDSISWEIMGYGKTDYVFTGGAGACCSDGVRASGGAPL